MEKENVLLASNKIPMKELLKVNLDLGRISKF